MTRRNLNLPISNDHGLTAAQIAEFCAWVAGHPFKGDMTHQEEAWAIAESIDNCFDVRTTEALECAMATFENAIDHFACARLYEQLPR